MIRWLFRTLLVACLCVITWLALTSDPPVLAVGLGWDKANHLLAFAVLGFLGHYSVQQRQIWKVFICLAMYGLFLELAQLQLKYRSFEWYDLGADLLGLGLYLLVSPIGQWIPPLAEIRSKET